MILSAALLGIAKAILGQVSGTVISMKKAKLDHMEAMANTKAGQEQARLKAEADTLRLEIEADRNAQSHYQATHGPPWTRIPMFLIEASVALLVAAAVFRHLYGYETFSDPAGFLKWVATTVIIAMFGRRISEQLTSRAGKK